MSESIDTRSDGAACIFPLIQTLNITARTLIREQTRTGMYAARDRGARLGRPPALTPEQIEEARALVASGLSGNAVAKDLGIAPSTLWRALNAPPAAHG